MERKPRCYVPNNKGYDLSPLAVYGDTVFLYENQASDIFMTSKHAHYIKDKLKDMESSDYLVCVGNIILNMLAFGVIMEKFGFVNMLLYDVRTMTYTPRVIPKWQLQKTKEA
jgi:hypothetical protein